MKKITVILAHANFNKSIANKKIAEFIQNEYSNIDIMNLSEMYPDLKIGVEAEQENLKKSDIIILQFLLVCHLCYLYRGTLLRVPFFLPFDNTYLFL